MRDQCRATLFDQPLAERRIDKHDIKLFIRPGEPGKPVGLIQVHSSTFGMECFDIVLQLAEGGIVLFHQADVGRTARERFKTQHAGTGKQVQAFGSVDDGLQPVEQGFADAIRRWPEFAVVRDRQLAPAPFSPDDADLAWRPVFQNYSPGKRE